VRFDLRLNSLPGKAVLVPTLSADEGMRESVFLAGVDVERGKDLSSPLGRWGYIQAEPVRYARSRALAAGESLELRGVEVTWVLRNAQLADLEFEPSLRFHLWLFSRLPEGRDISTSVITEAVRVDLLQERSQRARRAGNPVR